MLHKCKVLNSIPIFKNLKEYNYFNKFVEYKNNEEGQQNGSAV